MVAPYALIGLLTGAFLNYCADQPPHWRRPRRLPFCPYCDQPRPPWAWISALAFLRFKPECQHCAASISLRHPLVELGTSILFAVLVLHYGPSSLLMTCSAYSAVFVLLVVIDLEHRIIPNVIIYPAWGLALVGSMVSPVPGFYRSALVAGVIGFGLLFLVFLIGKLFVRVISQIRGKRITTVAFGPGDVRLGAFIGLVLGVPQVFLALILAMLLGGLAAFLYWLVHAFILRRYTLFTTMPYSPHLVGGAMITISFGPLVSPWLLRG